MHETNIAKSFNVVYNYHVFSEYLDLFPKLLLYYIQLGD